jgi:heme-degrading monooxygenase HmoA
MAETYTSAVWTVKPGEEDAFAAAWEEFVRSASEQPGSGTFRLVRDLEQPNRYMSFAPWESFEAQHAWKQTPEFAEWLTRVRQYVDAFEPSTYELVIEVD